MKKLFAMLLIVSAGMGSCAVQAEAHDYGRRGGGGCGACWVAPALIGGIIGYELSRPQVYSPPPVYVQPQTYVYSNGYYYQGPMPVMNPPYGYHWEQMVDNLGRRTLVAVPN
jgi:hypothetical protein